jgi:phosphopantothenoylcysteine decarboxylase/phosphopantothenate--cysteine ligase
MWSKPAVKRGVAQLLADGVTIIDPEEGWLSCRDQGPGRMANPEKIRAAIETVLKKGSHT